MKKLFISGFFASLLVSLLILTSFGFTEGMGRDTSVLTVPESNPSSYMYIYCKRSKQNPYCQRQFSKHFFVHSLMKNEEINKYDAISAPGSGAGLQPSYKSQGLLAKMPSRSTEKVAAATQKPAEEFPVEKLVDEPVYEPINDIPPVAQNTIKEKPAATKPVAAKPVASSGKIYIFKADKAALKEKTGKPEIITAKTSAPKTIKVERAAITAPKAPQIPINSKDYLIKWIKDIYGVEVASNHTEAEIADMYTRLMWCSTIQKELNEECDYRINSSDELRARYETAKNI